MGEPRDPIRLTAAVRSRTDTFLAVDRHLPPIPFGAWLRVGEGADIEALAATPHDGPARSVIMLEFPPLRSYPAGTPIRILPPGDDSSDEVPDDILEATAWWIAWRGEMPERWADFSWLAKGVPANGCEQ